MKYTLLNKLKKNKAILHTYYLFQCSLIGLLVTFLVICSQNNVQRFFEQKEQRSYEKEPVFITFEIPLRSDGQRNCWQQDNGEWGAEYDIYIHNNSRFNLERYEIQMAVPVKNRIDSSWNAEYIDRNGIIRMIPLEDSQNVVVLPGETKKFGFILYSDELIRNTEFTFSGYMTVKPFRSPLFLAFGILTIVGLFCFIASIFNYFSLRRQAAEAQEKMTSLVRLCASFIDARDAYTKMHSIHVAEYSRLIAKELGMNEEQMRNVYYNGMMHDIGKVLIPKEILCKPARLDDQEWDEMKQHTTLGAEIICDFDEIQNMKDAVLYHHERYDGKGYMSGLRGEQIPIVARIICVADAYDAMSTDRAYRKRLQEDVIIDELRKGSGSQFDPEIATIMIDLIKTGALRNIV